MNPKKGEVMAESQEQAPANKLVMTQADLPPGIDAPSPELSRQSQSSTEGSSPSTESVDTAEIIHEIRKLADRVGGIRKLHQLVRDVANMQ
jgi:hypothetical protein